MAGDDAPRPGPDDAPPYRTPEVAHSLTLARLAERHPSAPLIYQAEQALGAGAHERVGTALGRPAPAGCLVGMANVAGVGTVLALPFHWVSMPRAVVVGAVVVAANLSHVVARWRWRRQLAAALAWVDRYPFPVTGLRGYLVAAQPMVDVEFKTAPVRDEFTRAVARHLPGAEVIAIDRLTMRVVVPARDRTADDTTSPVALQPDTSDRAWLRRFFDEVLAPLHGELGIVRVELGGTAPAPQARLGAPPHPPPT
ncbi:MAG: hypothetical protein R3B06_25420 [Kofleriaceae bacterium]